MDKRQSDIHHKLIRMSRFKLRGRAGKLARVRTAEFGLGRHSRHNETLRRDALPGEQH